MEQPKKPGAPAPGARDITDLKARLGLNKGAAAPGAAPAAAPRAPFPGAPVPAAPAFPAPAPPPGYAPPAGSQSGAPAPFPGHVPVPPGVAPPAPAPVPEHDPFAAIKPPPGRQFDLRPVDDGVPAESVRSGGSKVALVVGLVLAGVGLVVGYFFGLVAVGRQNYNSANRSARAIQTEVTEMQKVIGQVQKAIADSNSRIAAERKPPLSYEPKLIEALEGIKLDPRPSTGKIFHADYARLEDLAIDQLMNYYYDTLNLYGEVDRFVRKTKADKKSLEDFAAKQGEKGQTNYGVVFDTQGKFAVGKLVELGQPICKGGGSECPADKVEKLEVRMNSGGSWQQSKVGPKPEPNTVVPLDRSSPLMESALSGSQDQARMEQYRQRLGIIIVTLQRINITQKTLLESLAKAAAREDRWAP